MPLYLTPPNGNTSQISDFPATRDVIVRRALRIVGAYTSTDNPRPEQLTDALVALNMMLKTWSVEGFLWLRDFVTVPFVAGQNTYLLGPASTPPIDRPLHVYSANRKSAQGNELPITALTRSDWMALPNKATQGVPVQYYYNPTQTNGTLYVWPTPATGTTDSALLDVDRQLDIMVDNLDTFDLPPQWLEAVVAGLAVRIAPEYGLPLNERAQLAEAASALFMKLSTDDRDIASIHFGVRRP